MLYIISKKSPLTHQEMRLYDTSSTQARDRIPVYFYVF